MTVRRSIVLLLSLGLVFAAVVGVGAATAKGKPNKSNEDLRWVADNTLVGKGAHTKLTIRNDSTWVNGHSRNLTPGNVYTVWLFDVREDPPGPTNPPKGQVAGGIANGGGNFNFRGHVDGVGNAVVILDHGPASDDPAVLQLQLTTPGGGCPPGPPCPAVQHAIHTIDG